MPLHTCEVTGLVKVSSLYYKGLRNQTQALGPSASLYLLSHLTNPPLNSSVFSWAGAPSNGTSDYSETVLLRPLGWVTQVFMETHAWCSLPWVTLTVTQSF